MVPRNHTHALPFLTGLQLDLRMWLPKYAVVNCSKYVDDVSLSLHVHIMRGLLQDFCYCVQHSAQHAVPVLQQGPATEP